MLIAKSDARGAKVVPPLLLLPGASEGRPIDGRGSALGASDGRPAAPAPLPPLLLLLLLLLLPPPLLLLLFVPAPFVNAWRRTGPKDMRFRFRSLSRSRPKVLRRPAIVNAEPKSTEKTAG